MSNRPQSLSHMYNIVPLLKYRPSVRNDWMVIKSILKWATQHAENTQTSVGSIDIIIEIPIMICDMKSKCVNSGLNYHSKINHVVNLVKSKIVVKLLEP